MQFISTYFFETKERDEDNYKSIVKIFAVSICLPIATCIVFSYLAFHYSEWIAKQATRYIESDTVTEECTGSRATASQSYGTATEAAAATDTYEGKKIPGNRSYYDKRNRREKISALTLSSIGLSIVLVAFHIAASIRLIQYGNEVLYDGNNDEHYNLGKNDRCLLIVYIAFSFFFPLCSLLYVLCFTLYKLCIHCNSNRHNKKNLEAGTQNLMSKFKNLIPKKGNYVGDIDVLGKWLQFTLGWLLVYLGFYFLPYMLLALIHDPIQTAFVYLIIASFILCVYLLAYGLCLLFSICTCTCRVCCINCTLCSCLCLLFSICTCTCRACCIDCTLCSCSCVKLFVVQACGGMSIAYFLTILLFILTLGNFHDFQAVENLTVPIIIGLLFLFVLKPLFKYGKRRMKDDTANKTPKEDD